MAGSYYPRLVDPVLAEILAESSAVLLTGPRACGKTTTALRHSDDIVRLDRPREAAIFRADPDAALAQLRGVAVLDEWQEVPQVLPAVKRAVDSGTPPAHYLLTGSVRADDDARLWPGTGRLVRLGMSPLTRAELAGHALSPPTGLISRIRVDGLAGVRGPESPPDLPEYLRMCVAGGMPSAANLRSTTRRRWYASYLEQLATHDVRTTGERPDPGRVRSYLRSLAENTAGLPSATTLYEGSGINAKTAAGYDRLLVDAGILDLVPGWTSNRVKRAALRRKVYLTDTGLIAAALSVDVEDLMRDGHLTGRMLDSFVAAQLRPELLADPAAGQLFHLRDKDGRHEVDLVLDLGHRGVVAIEVTATASPAGSDAVHLEWLRDRLGPRFVGGLVLGTGPRAFTLSDRIIAAPIACLWA